MKITLGADPKKTAILAGLSLVAAYLLYNNFRDGSPGPSVSAPARTQPAVPATKAPASAPAPGPNVRRAVRSDERVTQEFRPSLKPKRPEERVDPATIDPALRLDLLAKLQQVKFEGGHRSLFEFSQPRPPKTPEVKITPRPGLPGGLPVVTPAAGGPKPNGAEPVKPPPPPITFKYFGFISPSKGGAKRAFFLDGEDIFVAGEGETFKQRYRVVRIGVNSAVVEDTQHKHQQTLALEEQPS